jgi:uncharacterized membrane protein
MPLIAADNSPALAAVIFSLAWLGFWIDRQPISRYVPGVPWVIATGVLLSNTGIIPREAPAFAFVGQYLLPMGIPLLLFKANLRNVFSQSGWVLPAFLLSSLGVCIGAASGFVLFDLGAEGARIAGTYAGAFIGGVANFVAISQALEMSPTQFSVALSASAPASVLGLLVLVTLPALPFVRRHVPSPYIDAADKEDPAHVVSNPVHLRLDHLAAATAISLALCAAAGAICAHFGIETYKLFVISLLVFAVANIAPRQFARLEGDFELGMFCMYAFFAMIGAGTDAVGFLHSAPILFVYCSYMLGIQFVVLLLGARLFRIDLAPAIIGAAAAIVGAGAAAAIASSKGWKTLISPGITIGMLGYAIANFIGIALAKLLM